MIGISGANALDIRKRIIRVSFLSGAGHITSSLSSVEILCALYSGGVLRYDGKNPQWPDRDRFVLSKGHATLALYNVLCDAGFVTQGQIDTFCRRGSDFGGLTTTNVPGVECYSGSLGHGLSMGVGMALYAKAYGKDYLTYVLTGDGECQEGSIWEAAMSISHLGLNNLIWIIDKNNIQLSGKVTNIMGMEPFEDKFKAFGFETRMVDGHNIADLLETLKVDRNRLSEKPITVIANTVKGKGVPFLENKEGWHGRKPNKEELDVILEQLGMARSELEGAK